VAYAGRRKLRTPDAAAYVGLAASTLNKMRVRGDGPVYSKLGRIVVYDVADLDGWLEVNKRASTSDGAA
jgi:predicted DNA-binding transcriptional regulator AlpA